VSGDRFCLYVYGIELTTGYAYKLN
jgi:elongation factor P--beta-lysine ligase